MGTNNQIKWRKSLYEYCVLPEEEELKEWYFCGQGLRERLFICYLLAKKFDEFEEENTVYYKILPQDVFYCREGKKAYIEILNDINLLGTHEEKTKEERKTDYMAPEIVAGYMNPDILSNRYTLAVFIFELLRMGRTEETSLIPAEMAFTNKLEALFERAFSNAGKNRMKRPEAKEFMEVLLEASDMVCKCPSCMTWHFFDRENETNCPRCKRESGPVAHLLFFDRLYKANGKKINDKIVYTYALRNGRNGIRQYYVLPHTIWDDKDGRMTTDYMTVEKEKDGYYAYNRNSKEKICIYKCATKEYVPLTQEHPILLQHNDLIVFEEEKSCYIKINCGGEEYGFRRIAIFKEENK